MLFPDNALKAISVRDLIGQLARYPKRAQVIFGPGYVGPKLEYHPQRFNNGVLLEHGPYSLDHNPRLRPELVPEVKVGKFIEFLKGIPGSSREAWKGGHIWFMESTPVYIALEGEVGLGVVGAYMCSDKVTIISVYM